MTSGNHVQSDSAKVVNFSPFFVKNVGKSTKCFALKGIDFYSVSWVLPYFPAMACYERIQFHSSIQGSTSTHDTGQPVGPIPM